MRPVRTSNFVGLDPDKLQQYITNIDWDLKKLYQQLNSEISIGAIKIGGLTTYAKIDSSGHFTLAGSATVWNDLVMPLTATKQGALSKPDFDYTNVGFLFPQNDATEILYINNQLPHSWKIGSTIYPHVHWCQGNSTNVTYKIDYKWMDLVGSTTATFTTLAIDTTAFAYISGSTMHQKSINSTGVSAASITSVSAILCVKLYRDDDVYPGDVLTYMFDIHYEMDSLGSNFELVK